MTVDVSLQKHLTHGGYGMDMIYWDQAQGSIALGICDVCHYIEAYCEHRFNSWNEDETILTCDLCGVDGT